MVSVREIFDQVVATGIKHVVLTGGEPMLFDPIEDLAQLCRDAGLIITIETAGTIYRDLPCDLMSISPKLSHSTPPDVEWKERHETSRIQLDVLRQLIDTYNFQLKFVINSDEGEDLAEIDQLLAQLPTVPAERVLLMPEGTDSETLNRRARALVPVVMARNWRLAPRLHIDLFGNTKGT